MMFKKENTTSTFVALFVMIAVALTVVPLMTIWSLNTLFAMTIDYNINTWAASWWIGFVLGGGFYVAKRK